MYKIFIDTEFTDFTHTGLISIALVAETGEEAYFETQYLERECSDFVKDVVLPLLGREPNAYVPKSQLPELLRAWLSIVRPGQQDVCICYDYMTDWNLLVDALDGNVPSWVKGRNIAYDIQDLLYVGSSQKKEFKVR